MKWKVMNLKRCLSLSLFLIFIVANAQVGIGTVMPNAALDITSTTDGLLIPRVALTNTTTATVITPTISELVYNSATVNDVSPGYYYWDGIKWNRLAVGNNSDWSILGNSGTTPATNFLGTTDDKDIVLKRNNIRAGYIGDPFYDGSFNYNNGNTAFGANSLLNPTINFATQTGVRNVAFGTNVMPGLTTGQRNVGVGDISLFLNASGSENTAIGVGALYSNVSAFSNVAIGRNALTTNNANNNTGVGFAALRQNAAGTNNTAIGYEALRNVLGNGNVGIGFQAGRLETGSNKLYISNSNADANNALVYGEFDNKILRTNAQLQINDPATTGYKFPVARGTNKQVMETDGSGNLSWTTPNSSFSVVRSNLAADQLLNNSGWQKIALNTVAFDTNLEYNTTLNRFVALRAGYYQINAAYHTFLQSDTNFYSIGVRKNGALYQERSGNHSGNTTVSRNITCIVSLVVGDFVEIFAENYTTGVTIDSYSGKTYFEIQQIR